MNIDINYAYRKDDMEKLPIEDLAQFVLISENMPFTTEVSITFCTNGFIAELNQKFRGKEGPTDVLSFECDSVADDLSASLLSENPIYELGDVIIAPDVAEKQADEYGNSFEEEVSLLLVHGLLHLCGYDHIKDDEAKTMEAREKELLAAWDQERID